MKHANGDQAFREGLRPLGYKKSFVEKVCGKPCQYVGLIVNGRRLHTPDMREEDAEIICEFFNEGIVRRFAAARKKTKAGPV